MLKATEVMGHLRNRYAPPSWALLEEVRDGTGFSTAGRSMDAMAFGLWPSRGLEIHGFEIKVFRGDWHRELKQPEKAESFYQYVDRWWIVAGDDEIVKPDELPKTWGLLSVKNGKLRAIVEAPVKKAKPCSRIFMMAIIRRIQEAYYPKSRFDQLVAEKVAQNVDLAVQNATFGRDAIERDKKELEERIAIFEQKSGVRIDRWDAERIGEAVAVVRKHSPSAILDHYGYVGRRMNEIAKDLAQATEEARDAFMKLELNTNQMGDLK